MKPTLSAGVGFFTDGDPGIYVHKVRKNGELGRSLTEKELSKIADEIETGTFAGVCEFCLSTLHPSKEHDPRLLADTHREEPNER